MTKANFAPAVSLSYTTRNYTGDGSDTTFTVTNGATVDSVIVTENGVVQKPTTDYTISGTTLTFQGGAPDQALPHSRVHREHRRVPVQHQHLSVNRRILKCFAISSRGCARCKK